MLPAEPSDLKYKGQRIIDDLNKEVLDFMGEQLDLMFYRGFGQRGKAAATTADEALQNYFLERLQAEIDRLERLTAVFSCISCSVCERRDMAVSTTLFLTAAPHWRD